MDAIRISLVPHIEKNKCIGCAACIANCPHGAIKINWLGSVGGAFREKLAEYALAAQQGKQNIYINFALQITKGCDCVGQPMKPICDDYGIFASIDPVAVDHACWEMMKKKGCKPFSGKDIFPYAEKIGLGSTQYQLHTIEWETEQK